MARSFSGSSQQIYGTANELEITGDITVSAWLKTTSTAVQLFISTYTTAAPYVGWGVGTGQVAGGKLCYWSNGNGAWRGANTALNNGAWRHVAVRVSGTGAGAGTFYLDGSADGTWTHTSPGTSGAIKRYGASAFGNWFNGQLAEVAVWSGAVDAADIAALADGVSPNQVSPGILVSYRPLWGRYTNEIDLVSGSDLTVTGATYADHPPVRYARDRRRPIVAGGGPASYSLSCSPGSFALTGGAASLPRSLALASAPGSLTMTGGSAALERALILGAAPGSLALTGGDAALTLGVVLAAASGSLALTGGDASLERALTLSAAAGSFALTGGDATLTTLGAFTLNADPGSLALTGGTASLVRDLILTAASGSLALTGGDAALTAGVVLTADAGSLALTGGDAALTHAALLAAAAGTLTLTGGSATLERALILGASPGSLALTGGDAALNVTHTLAAASGSLALTGGDASLERALILGAATGSFALSGGDATLLASALTLDASPGAFTLTGGEATLTYVVTTADPVRVYRFAGRADNRDEMRGRADNAPKLQARADNRHTLPGGRDDVPAVKPMDCHYGEAVLIDWNSPGGVDITDWTLELRLLSAEGGTTLVTRSIGSGITLTAPTTGKAAMTFTSAQTSRTPGTYFYTIWRTDAGSETELNKGTFSISLSEGP